MCYVNRTKEQESNLHRNVIQIDITTHSSLL